MAAMPSGLGQALGPVLQQIAEMTLKIKQYDRQIQQLGQICRVDPGATLCLPGMERNARVSSLKPAVL